ncbi:MAG: transglycosylase SLT domain-containing protein [Patescibacteria group bacterium]
MSFEYKGVPPKNNDAPKKKQTSRSKEEPKSGEGVTRRGFLKVGSAFITALVAGRAVDDFLTENKEAGGESGEINGSEKIIDEMEKVEAEREQFEYEKGETEYKTESIKSLGDLLDFDKVGPIRFDPEKMEGAKSYWKEAYAGKNPKLHKSLLDGYREWGYWRIYTEQRFKSVGIPIEYALLALPESHWKVNARSKSGAVGPYQFMPKTAASLKLIMNRVIDERRDPVKSAEACALVLKELHAASGDWNVTLSGYNGGDAWRFIKEAKSKGQPTNYGNFLKYLEEKLNKIKDHLRTNKKFGSLSHEAKREIFARKIQGLSENLNYPPKFHAIEELIREGKIREQQAPIRFKEEKIIQTETAPGRIEHIVAKGETLFKIARKLNIPPQELYKYNRRFSGIKKLQPGDKIEIPPAKKKAKRYFSGSLTAEALKKGKSIQEMRFLNPHILDAQAPLPHGTFIRV